MNKEDQLLKEIKPIDIERYCQFWGISSFVWDVEESNKVYELQTIIDKSNVNIDDGNAITITNKVKGELKITFSQLIYDIYAFVCLNSDIWPRISAFDFLNFIRSRFAFLREHGWHIIFDKNCIYPQLKDIQNDEVGSEYALKKVLLIKYSENASVDGLILDPDNMWIQEYFFQEVVRIYFMDSIIEYYKRSLAKFDVTVISVNWSWALNHCLYPTHNITTKKIKERDKYLIGNLRYRVEEEKEFLNDIYDTDDISYDEMFDIPDKIMINRGMLRHVDNSSKYVNVIAGRRLTSDTPDKFLNTVYMLGGCVFFGYAIEDQYTVPSCLQRILNKECRNKYRVVNISSWGGNIDEEHNWLRTLRYKSGDIVFISYAGLIPAGDNYKETDISKEFPHRNNKVKYFNTLIHCNHYGYQAIAENIYDIFKNVFLREYTDTEYRDVFNSPYNDIKIERIFNKYYKEIITHLDKGINGYGAVVMNCNPFTNGHRYLIEEASKREDHVLVFVVEEDKSDFRFDDRIELVKEGVKDIENVTVLRSSPLMISSITFPEYFTKKEKNVLNIDPSQDVFLFAKLIAPRFRIHCRYVGEEKKDLVTRKYNEVMKEILPTYGINLVEIPRKEVDGEIISASSVRDKIREQAWDEVKRMVPITTYDFIEKHFIQVG